MEEGRGMLQGGSHLQTLSMVRGGTATITISNRECVLMSMLGGDATTISTLKRVCAHSMLGGGTAIISILNCVCVLMSMLIPTLKRVCSCQCLEVAQPQSPCILEPRVCVLMSRLEMVQPQSLP